MEQSFVEFKESILHPEGKKRNFKVQDSWGIYDIYKHIRKNKWYNIGRPLKEHEFYSIVRMVNNQLAEEIAKGHEVKFPHKMGKLELRKYQQEAKIKNGKLKVPYAPDWNETLKLWYADEEARKNKIILRHEEPYIYSVRYNKYDAVYDNKCFYAFTLNSFIRRALKDNIKNGITDTIW